MTNLADYIDECRERYKGDLLISVALTDEQWQQIIAALRRQDNTALILRCRNCGSTNVEDAKPSSDKVLVPRVPTLAMLEAGRASQSFGDEEISLDDMRLKWNAMLDAVEAEGSHE